MEAGNVAYRNKEYWPAIRKWREALGTFTVVPTVLANLASARKCMEGQLFALLEAAAVLEQLRLQISGCDSTPATLSSRRSRVKPQKKLQCTVVGLV